MEVIEYLDGKWRKVRKNYCDCLAPWPLKLASCFRTNPSIMTTEVVRIWLRHPLSHPLQASPLTPSAREETGLSPINLSWPASSSLLSPFPWCSIYSPCTSQCHKPHLYRMRAMYLPGPYSSEAPLSLAMSHHGTFYLLGQQRGQACTRRLRKVNRSASSEKISWPELPRKWRDHKHSQIGFGGVSLLTGVLSIQQGKVENKGLTPFLFHGLSNAVLLAPSYCYPEELHL